MPSHPYFMRPVVFRQLKLIPEYISEESAFLIDYDAQFVENFATGLDHLNHDQTLRQQMREEALKERMRHSQERYYDEFVNCINHFVDE